MASREWNYDDEGYERKGYDRKGYDRSGFNVNGYDINGYDRDGYDERGFDMDGFNLEGVNRYGISREVLAERRECLKPMNEKQLLTEINFRIGWILALVTIWSVLGFIGFFLALAGTCAGLAGI